ncbi:hypothetical protein C0992_003132 [Termitomyces sp. T32_za158]|nr:hypothetical protein C0992_003132 [Termitomyces sp. T32_za158]
MASGSYDGLHSSASYGHGDSWRPSAGSSWMDRDAYYARRSASPGRRYPSYDAYYPQEDRYRPNSYRPEDDDPYFSRSPSPDHYSRYGRPIDTWDRTEPWGGIPAPWDEPMVASTSPTSSTSKIWRDPMIATRMFEPSDSWKQSHVDRFPRNDSARFASERHVGDPPQPRTPNSYHPDVYHPLGDSYRPMAYRDVHVRSDYYRPGPGWIERNRRLSNPSPRRKNESSNRYNDHSIKEPASVSIISSVSPHQSSIQQGQTQERRSHSRSPPSPNRSPSRSISRGRQSRSRTRSKSDRSLSPGRLLVHKPPITATAIKGSLSSPVKEAASVKYSWDRPTTIFGKASTATTVMYSKALPSSQPQKSSWTRSDSRSSIASTQGSDGAPNPSKPLSSDAQGSFSARVAKEQELQQGVKSVVQLTDVEMGPSVLDPATAEFDAKGVTETSAKTICGRNPSPISSLARVEATTSSSLTIPRVAESASKSLPLLIDGSSAQAAVNGIVDPLIIGFQPANVKSESQESTVRDFTDMQKVQPNLTPTASIARVPDTNQKDSAVDGPQPILADSCRTGVSVVSLPTPLPTPQPTPNAERAPSPYLPESIPTEALSMRDALRIVVMTRLLCDRQARDERVDPVLKTNQALAVLSHHIVPSSTSEQVAEEVSHGPGPEKRAEKFAMVRGSLVERFEERQNALTEKVQCLRQEYLLLHERWLAHCATLDEQNKVAVTEPEIVQPTGRTTRRSTANLGDAVRSDLEMEQIIASLGNDEATDPNHLSLRNLATIPDMISVTHGKVDYTYDDTNHSVINPAEYYGPRTGIDDWNEEEKKVFLDKFAAHPKQFGMIAEYLANKTAAQCVDYYYLHKKKIIDFRKVVSQYAPNKRKRGRTGKKKGNALLADIRQHDAEVHGEFGSPRSSGRPSRGRKPVVPSESREVRKAPSSRRRSQLDLTPSAGSATPTPEPETRRRGGRRSAAAPLSRTVSVSLEDGEEEANEEASERPTKRVKRGGRRVIKTSATITDESGDTEVKVSPETVGRRKSGGNTNQWSDEDKNIFLTLLAQHGDDFKRIAASMPNKTSSQVGNYYKANCDELDLEKIAAGAPQRSPMSDASDDLPEVPTPSTAETPGPEASDELMSPLAQDPPQTNGIPASRYPGRPAEHETSSKVPATWRPPPSRPLSPPLPTSHIRGYYPINHRPTSYYPPHPHPMPAPAYVPPVPYTYPPYTAPPYPQYDLYHRLSPNPLDPSRRMPMPIRTRGSSYPVLPQPGQPLYHYPLES